MNLKDTLLRLTNTLGGSGKEFAVSYLVRDLVRAYVDKVEIDGFGCVIACKNSNDPEAKTVLLDAHIDQMVMVTTGITEDGFLRFIAQGFDPRQLYGADVLVETRRNGLIPGVVNTVPKAFNAAAVQSTVKVAELTVDIGYPPERVREMVSIGDYIYYANDTIELACDTVCGRAMDDRAGTAILLETARRISTMDVPVNVVFSFTPREETGGPGASLTGYLTKPDMAIAVDGSHAKCYAYSGEGSFDFDAGAIIGFGDHSYPAIAEALIAAAKAKNIPYVTNLIPAHSKTNAGRLEYAGLGIPTGVVEFPMRYAHSSVEIADINNLAMVSNLLTEFLMMGGTKQ